MAAIVVHSADSTSLWFVRSAQAVGEAAACRPRL